MVRSVSLEVDTEGRRYPADFRQRAIELARTGDQPVAKVTADLGTAPSCLRRSTKQDDINGGRREGLSTDERAELVISDNGACYRSNAWKAALAATATTPKRTRPYRPQTNGKIDRRLRRGDP